MKLYKDSLSCTKENLMKVFDVTTIKTVENTLKEEEDITYDKKLKRYRFKDLLPKKIPYEIFFDVFEESIINKDIKQDFSIMNNNLDRTLLIETEPLSELSKKIIELKTAINSNCILMIKYKKNGWDSEDKYIKPHTIFSNGFTYYLYASYHEKNGKNVNETRSFEFNHIENIQVEEYSTSEVFKKVLFGNAFGPYQKDKYILLEFDRMSTDFFKKANIFNNPSYEIIDINENTLIAKMYYNSLEIEVVKFIQQWMPHIKISDKDENKNKIYKIIKENFDKLIF